MKGRHPPGMSTFIITKKGEVMSVPLAYHNKYYQLEGAGDRSTQEVLAGMHRIVDFDHDAPNLALNIQGPKLISRETWIIAILGMAVQVGAVVMSGIVRYRWQEAHADRLPPSYAYPFYLIGSAVMSGGILGCGYVVDAVTAELSLRCKANMATDISVVRIQQACTVGDQEFGSHAIFNPFENPDIHVSKWVENKGEYRYVVAFTPVNYVLRHTHRHRSLDELSICLPQQPSSASFSSSSAFEPCIGPVQSHNFS